MVDKDLMYTEKRIGQKHKLDVHLSVQELKQNND